MWIFPEPGNVDPELLLRIHADDIEAVDFDLAQNIRHVLDRCDTLNNFIDSAIDARATDDAERGTFDARSLLIIAEDLCELQNTTKQRER